MIYVQNTIGGDVRAYDETKDYAPRGVASLGDELIPDSVVLSADKTTLYANATNRWEFWREPTLEPRSAFAAFDAVTMEEKWRLPLLGSIEHFAASPDKRFIYNAHNDRKLVSKVDVETQTVTPIQIANLGGHKVRVSADGTRVYVGSIIWGSFDEIDATTDQWVRHFTFDDNVRPFALCPDGRTAYIQLSRMHGFHVFDLEDWRVVKTIDMPGMDDGAAPPCEDKYPFTVDHGVEVTPDGKYVIFLATTGGFAAVYEYPSLKFVKKIPLGKQPSYLTVSKDSTRCYISCRASCEIWVIDLDTLEPIHVIERAGAFPQRICLDH
ncbi:MAG: hypothetical protein AAF224_07155 [Pseudomonadota bacterium]